MEAISFGPDMFDCESTEDIQADGGEGKGMFPMKTNQEFQNKAKSQDEKNRKIEQQPVISGAH